MFQAAHLPFWCQRYLQSCQSFRLLVRPPISPKVETAEELAVRGSGSELQPAASNLYSFYRQLTRYLHPISGRNRSGSSFLDLPTLAESGHNSTTLVQNGAESQLYLVASELTRWDIIHQSFHIPGSGNNSLNLLKDAHSTVYEPYEIRFKLGQFLRFGLGFGQVDSQVESQYPDLLAEPIDLVNQVDVSVILGFSVQLDKSTF